MENLVEKIKNYNATKFQKQVWLELLKIPKGKISTYKQIAISIGNPNAVRAVGSAIGKNPFAPDVPCHRVVKTDFSLGGYSGEGGIMLKKKLLEAEDIHLDNLSKYLLTMP